MAMHTERRINPTHKAINKPLTILGAERKLFFVALIMGAAAFNLFGSLLGGMLLFGCLFLLAQWATRTDPQILRILLNSGKFRREYDPTKFFEPNVRVIEHA
jgi:type IV secretory pathway TrbD component